ncbi:cation channel sperm-associated auxiliary subunit gamma isoform X1 [Monodelphis domestica]|uniref:Cation channel sperm associated auxiliary subunit gamma n=2 Tax=Monodelphis domestica TaxID=13616 RepID=F7ACK9_MONDO|nr:cation channel sperm-associated auxiliary subunit gamma isoform X1 [Monodelphis domestica]XP_056652135.1 cation channel sperm-associated auxiliary subunit gamma isoform X1 [Monodelphis domestica]
MARLFGLLLLLLPPPPVLLWAQLEDKCRWNVVLNKYRSLGKGSEKFVEQLPISLVELFRNMKDLPVDLNEMYLGFPYYLRINYTCSGENPEAFVRGGFLKGLVPIVLVTFSAPVNFRKWKSERLQIEMEGAPFLSQGTCMTEEGCILNWFTPMPMKNGSLVMEVEIKSNRLGELIRNARFLVNINGFMKREKGKLIFTLGAQARGITHRDFINTASRPVWSTVGQAPVLILGGIPDEKMILISDSGFDDFTLVELNIDSCWLGSLECSQDQFTASIFDTISTESTLFIRQNQLIYYFTGNYFNKDLKSHSSSNWVRVLHNRCIKKLCPVEIHSNGSEYLMALSGGNEEGFFYFGTITDGKVNFKRMPIMRSLCDILKASACWLHWVVYQGEEQRFFLLMEFAQGNKTSFQLLVYRALATDSNFDSISMLFQIPPFIPLGKDMDFVMLLGMETYTDYPLVPKGLFHNPFSKLLFIWGNAILQSYDYKNFIYLAEFPKESVIKYMTSSYRGEVACVTETEEIWFIVEGSFKVYQLYPSEGWNILFALSHMEASSLYLHNETSISIFYDSMGLQQLVYQVDDQGEGRLLKRLLPVNEILVYQQLRHTTYEITDGLKSTLNYRNLCPFQMMQLEDLPAPQKYTRLEIYHAEPPIISAESGYHTKVSLALYQGLVHHLLWLHSKYNKPYADPVHDPTWRWWRNDKQHKAFYYYQASNFQSAFGVYINMNSYGKDYTKRTTYLFPDYIYLDKGTIYSFSIYLSSRLITRRARTLKIKEELRLAVTLTHPGCVSVRVKEQNIMSQNGILFKVILKDRLVCFDQGISGHNLMKTSVLIKVVGSAGKCFLKTPSGHLMQGNTMIPMFIGCPPGKRLAFDITATLKYNKEENKRYFDCVHPDPEMPCFLFSDVFFPFFLIQDMVTGESGSFNGSYILKVIGGGTSLDDIVDYSEADIFRYNSPEDNTNSLIWIVKSNSTVSQSFSILRHNTSGIEWLCLENSPCYDIVPKNIYSPDFYFKVMVSNRGVDKSTYCDYQVIFLLHVHGLPLSSNRALLYLLLSMTIYLAIVFLYVLYCIIFTPLKKCWNNFKWKFNNLINTDTSSSMSLPSNSSFRSTSLQISEDTVSRRLKSKRNS